MRVFFNFCRFNVVRSFINFCYWSSCTGGKRDIEYMIQMIYLLWCHLPNTPGLRSAVAIFYFSGIFVFVFLFFSLEQKSKNKGGILSFEATSKMLKNECTFYTWMYFLYFLLFTNVSSFSSWSVFWVFELWLVLLGTNSVLDK